MFIKNTHLLLATLFSLGIIPGLSKAQEAYVSDLPVSPVTEQPVNEFDIGIGYISDDAYHFGRYNGMIDQGPYLIGNIKAKSYDEDGDFWKILGTSPGLDSTYLRLDAGTQGSQQFFIEYDQIYDFENNTSSTPFVNPGSSDLALPENYDADNLDSYLQPFDQKTERERLGVGGQLHIKRRWKLTGSLSQETQKGTDWIGGAMGPSREDNIFKWTNGALLPEPIDYITKKFDAALTYHGKNTQLEFAYHGSLFYNQDTSLSWTDPLENPDTTVPEDELHREGSISLEPDNQMQQLTSVLGHMFSPTSRLTALLSMTQLTQDQDFLPYSVSDTLDSLPQESLNGKVNLYRGQLKLTSRYLKKLRLSAKYSYDERDNKTAINSYQYLLADGVAGEPTINPRSNDPLSYQKQKVDLTANYRFNSTASLRGGYQFNHHYRDHDDDQVKTTREHIVSAKLKVKPVSKLNFDIYGETGKRRGSTYHTRVFENEDLRVLYLADLDRDKMGATINYMPTNRMSFVLTGDYINDDYIESEIGLKESRQESVLLNFSYQVTDRINTHAFYNYVEVKSTNTNENKEIEKGTFDVWEADLKDNSNSLGLGFNLDGLANKWDVGLDWVYTRGNGKMDMTGSQAQVDKVTGVITSDFVPIETQQFSDVKTSLSSLQLWTRYQYSDSIAVKFSYWYESYDTEDWAVDGTVNNYVPLENDTITQYLFMGEDQMNYHQHVVGLLLNAQF